MKERPTVIVSCSVLRELIDSKLPQDTARTYLDIQLHNTPKKLADALQSRLDDIEAPSTVIIGYGLCGNGIVGVNARAHTLIIPRTHDCVAIFLGSHQRYVQRFFANPNTYYLTRGWLEAHDDPLHDYLDYVRDYGEETADYLVDTKYRHYRRLCMIGFDQEELDACRPLSKAVHDFCAERWNMTYEETLGSTGLLETLLATPSIVENAGPEFVVIPPGGTITADQFHRSGEAPPAAAARRG